MNQFDKWHEFWDKFLLERHGKEEAQTEDDLYLQVARTVNKRPIAVDVFKRIVFEIITGLELEPDDILVDLCCGNGLFTYELSNKVKQIIGIEFSQKIIDSGNLFKSAPNISYCLGSVVEYLQSFNDSWPGVTPDKYLMNDSLAYFSDDDLEMMLICIHRTAKKFKFLIRGVPCDDLKWNYYKTAEQKAFYNQLLAKGDLTFDGLGRWWNRQNIINICEKQNLECSIRNQDTFVSDYRIDVLISNK